MARPRTTRFDAFISYGHAADGKLAPALEDGLKRFARPWNQRRALRVFRDDTGLAVNPDLWASIRSALDSAEWCILLASPQAARSAWVNQEIEHWKSTRQSSRILPVLTDGTLVWDATLGDFDPERSSALPPALQHCFDAEPRHLDLTWAHDETQLDLRHARFRDAVADLAAPIHGVPKDDLESEDVRQHRRARRARRATFVAMSALLVVAIAATAIAFLQRDVAVNEARVSDSQRLAIQAQSLTGSQLDRALLLATAGLDLDDSTASRQGVLAALGAEPELVAFDHRFGSTLGALGAAADGERFVVGDQDGTVRTWDGADEIGPRVHAGVGSILDIAFTPDGSRVLIAGDTGVRAFDPSLRPVGPLMAPEGVPEWIAVSPDGELLATSGSSGVVQLWRIQDGTEATPPIRVSKTRATGSVFDTTGETLWVGTYEGAVERIDTASGLVRGPAIPLSDDSSVYALALSPDGTILAASVQSGEVHLVDAASGKQLGAPLRFHESEPYSMTFSTDGSLLASADDDGQIAVWEPIPGTEPVHVLRGHGELVSELAFTSTRRLLSLAGGELARWDLDGEALGERHDAGLGALRAVAIRPGTSDVTVAALDGGELATWSRTGSPATATRTSTGLARVTALRWTPDGNTLLIGGGRASSGFRFGSAEGEVQFLDASGRTASASIDLGSAGVRAMDVSGDGRSLAIGDTLGHVTIWDLRSKRRLLDLAFETDEQVNSVAFSPDSDRVAAGSNSGQAMAWDTADGQPLWTRGTGANVNAVGWGPRGGSVVSANGLGQVVRLRAVDGRPIGSPTATGVGEAYSLAMSADGRLVALGGARGTLAVVDAGSGERLYVLTGRPAIVTGIEFATPAILMSVDDDGAVALRHLAPSWWRQRACDEAARPLSSEERRTYLLGIDLAVC